MADRKLPIVITGCGRSGTHWLGDLLRVVLGDGRAAHEPPIWSDITDVVVDSRLRHHLLELKDLHVPVIHLVRDGREVVRSLHTWWYVNGGGHQWSEVCEEWATAIDLMAGYPFVRLEDLVKRADPSAEHTVPHWTEWTPRMTDTFWRVCGQQMQMMGYDDG